MFNKRFFFKNQHELSTLNLLFSIWELSIYDRIIYKMNEILTVAYYM